MRAIIAGYGYLGEKIAVLLSRAGYELTVVRRASAAPEGFSLIQHDLVAAQLPDQSGSFDAAVFCLAPAIREPAAYQRTYCVAQQNFLAGVHATRYIYISSTAVYPDEAGDYYEDNAAPHSERAATLLTAEQIALTETNACVLRLAGLYSRERPIYHAGRTVYAEDRLVHFIHRDDAARAALHAVQHNLTGIYNVHDGNPLLRSDILRHLGHNAPVDSRLPQRHIHAEKFRSTGFTPIFPDYLSGTVFAENT